MTSNTISLQIGGALELILRPPPEEIQVVVTAAYESFRTSGRGNQMYTLPVDKLINVQVAYVDAHGNPTTVDGAVDWTSSNNAVIEVQVDPQDSTMCRIVPTGDVGTAQVTASADADLGTGTRELVTLLDITVVAGEAVAGTINVVGDPEPIEPHVEPRR
jgi:hypothetical protein